MAPELAAVVDRVQALGIEAEAAKAFDSWISGIWIDTDPAVLHRYRSIAIGALKCVALAAPLGSATRHDAIGAMRAMGWTPIRGEEGLFAVEFVESTRAD